MILFGMGALGKFMLAQLGDKVVAGCDNNPELWGTKVGGLPVYSPEYAVSSFPYQDFVVSIYNGSEVREQLRDMGVTPVHFMAVLGRDAVDHEKVAELMPLLADEASRCELNLQASGMELKNHSPIEKIYFPHYFTPDSAEVFVDCGAYNGDSIRAFKKWAGRWSRVYAIEPVEKVDEPAIVLPFAVGNESKFVRFSEAGPGSKESDIGRMVQVVRLDDVFRHYPPTFIKMDVEGAEVEAIKGAAEIISNHAPKLAICLYHKRSHLWEIPLLLHSLRPDYKLYIQRYAEDCWELVCYATL